MNYIKQPIINALLDKSPQSFMKEISSGLEPYFEYYSLVQYSGLHDFVFNFAKCSFFEIIGAQGCGKSSFCQIAKNIFQDTVKVFSYSCAETTDLDDIFFVFYKFMLQNPLKKDYSKFSTTVIKSSSIDEQVMHYIKNAPSNVVMIFDNFEKLLDVSNQIKNENIKSFFEYLLTLKNNKVIFFSTTNLNQSLSIAENTVCSIKLKGLDEEQVKAFFEIFKVPIPQSLEKEILDKTNGYIHSLKFLANAAKSLSISVASILKESVIRNEQLNSYIAKRLIFSLNENEKKILLYLSALRHQVDINVLKVLCNIPSIGKNLEKLKSYMLIEGENSFELREFLKELVYGNIQIQEKISIHEKIRDFYSAQIPLKPSERILELSRTTLYSEKFYHDNVVSKLSKNLNLQSQQNKTQPTKVQQESRPNSQTIKYIASTKYLPDWDLKEKGNFDIPPATQEQTDNDKDFANNSDIFNPLKDASNNETFHDSADDFNTKYPDTTYELNKIEDDDLLKADELLNEGIRLYQNADENSIEYLKDAMELLKDKDKDNYYLAKLTLARSYVDTMRYQEARKELSELLNYDLPLSINIDAQIELATIFEYENKPNEALKIYEKILKNANSKGQKLLCAKIHFKIALFYDDKNDTDKALLYYLLTASEAETGTDKSVLAPTYSNIASIYEEKNDIPKSIEFYKKALSIDEHYKNFEGQTKSLLALGNIQLNKNEKASALQYLVRAAQCAKQTDDTYLIATTYLELGDAFFKSKDFKNALKAYLLAKKSIDNTISTDSKNKIARRFEMIVDEIGEIGYRFLLQELKKK